MGRIPSAPALDSCNIDAIEDCPAPSPDVQEEGDHRSLHRDGHLERPLSSHQPVHALRSMSISQVPQGYEKGRRRASAACLLSMRNVRSMAAFPLRAKRWQFFEVGCAASRRVKTTCFV